MAFSKSINPNRITDLQSFTIETEAISLTLSLSVCLPGDEGEATKKSQDSSAKEKETQAEGS